MACPVIENLFIEHANLMRNDAVKMIQDSDFYMKRMPKEPWLDGNGYQYSYPIYERSLVTKAVTDADFFTAFSTPNATPDAHNNTPDDGACNLPGHNIDSFGITLKNTVLFKAAINSPDICLDTLRFQWQVMDQIKNTTRVLGENTKWVWSNQYQDQFIAAAANKVTAGIDGVAPTFGVPTSALTFGLLEEVHQELGFNGGGVNPTTRVDDAPVYTAVGSLYTFNRMKFASANQRADFQYSSAGGGSEQGILTQQIGLGGKIYQNYKFAVVQFPPRHDAAGVRLYPYVASNATKGEKWEVTDAYKHAFSEDTVIYHDDVLKVLIPKPQGAVGTMAYQQEFSWAGEFVWRNIPSRECNIDGNVGFFRALFAYGIKLERPDLGFVIRALLCPIALDLGPCPATS